MRIITLACLLLAGNVWSAIGADVKRFDLNGEGTLTIAVPQTIRVQFGPAEGGQPAHLILSDTNKVSEMRMVLGRSVVKLSDDQMKGQLLTAGQRLMSAVVEKEIKVQELNGSAFTYFYFELTGPTRALMREVKRVVAMDGNNYVVVGRQHQIFQLINAAPVSRLNENQIGRAH